VVAAASFHKDDVLNISLEKELNLNVYRLEDFCLCLRAFCYRNFTSLVRVMNETDNSFSIMFNYRNFKQEFTLVMQEISVAVAVTVVVMRETRRIGELLSKCD
jgi:hypothetical protein